MGNTAEVPMEQIREYGFAPLPPRIGRQEEEEREEVKTDKVAVQCQICGRMGMMTLDEMRTHHDQHSET